MKRLLATLFFCATLAAMAVGQGYIAQHSMPIGEGPGVQGWGTVGPCGTGQAPVWQSGATSDPSCAGPYTSNASPYLYGAIIASPTIVSAFTAPGLVTNADLANSSTTVNGVVCTLGGTCTIVAAAGSITVGTTSIDNATNLDVLYNNNGVLGQYPVTGSTSVVLAGSPVIVNPTVTSAFTATGLVTNADLANASTTVNSQTCTLGLTCTVPTNISSPTTGSGNVVLQTSAYIVGTTIASPTIVSAFTAPGLVTNADLANASTTVNGTTCTLGSSCFFSSTASAVIVGTTAVQGGTNPDVLYNNNGTLGNLPVTGATSAVLAGSPTIVNPTITSAFNATGLVTNADLANSTITINGVVVALGGTSVTSGMTGSGPVAGQASSYTYGSTTASLTVVSAFTATGLVTNSDLVNASTTVNSQTCTLGGSCTIATGGTSPTTGNGNVVLQTSAYIVGSTIASPTIVSAFTAPGLVTNADLANASTTPNGVTCTLGSTCTLTASASSIQPGVTSVYSGVSGNVLFSDSTKTLSLYNTTGTSWVVLSAAPTITSPTIPGTGSATAPLLIFSGCGVGCGIYAPGTNQLAITTNSLLRLDYNITNASAWTANKPFASNVTSAPNFLLDAIGINFGQLNNIDADTWALGYGPSVSINGTSAITWTDNGPITIAPSNFGLIVNSALSMAGSPPTNSGSCAVASQVGGNTAGTFVASGACAGGTYKLAFAYTAPHGWACDAEDRTTLTDTVRQNASTTSIATFTSTTASADVIQFKCMAY